jgi:SPP1 family predicted phage head-tail adaptor
VNLPHISAGSLDQLVTLQARSAGQDARGQASDTWVDVATNVWARVAPRRGRDFFAAGQEQATFDCTVLLRYRTDITASMRVLWQGQPLELVGEPVNVGGAGVYLELLCVRGPRAGAAS